MPIALAILASVLWGTADFFGGLAATGWRAERVATVSQVVGFGVLLIVAPVLTGGLPSGEDMWWGVAAGVTGAVGASLLYRALAIGPMSAAAPTIAVTAAVVPAFVGLAQGERPTAVALAGVAVAVVAIALVGGASAPAADEPRASTRVLVLSVAAGAALGLANVCFAQTSADAGLWPVASAKLVAFVLLGCFVLLTRADGSQSATGRGVRFSVMAGVFDVGATAAIAIALQRGSLVLVSVLGSLFPAVTVLLARLLLSERLGRVQAIGLALALAAVAMIVGG